MAKATKKAAAKTVAAKAEAQRVWFPPMKEERLEDVLNLLVLCKDALLLHPGRYAAEETDAQALRLLKRQLRYTALRCAAATTAAEKTQAALQMARVVDQLPEGWQTRALNNEVKETLPELVEMQENAKTVKSKIVLGLKMAALLRLVVEE